MSKQVQEFMEELPSPAETLLLSPLARAWMEKTGRLQEFETKAILQRQKFNSPEFRKKVEEHRLWREAEEKASSDAGLLGLSNHEGTLTKRDVRNAYRRMARKLHPDAGGNDEAFKRLHAAYRRFLARAKE